MKMQRTTAPSKEEVLAHCGLSSTKGTAEFHHWAYQPNQELHGQMDMLLHIVQRWFQSDQLSPAEVIKHIILNKFLSAFPGEERAMGMKTAKTPWDMVVALECTLATINKLRGEKQSQSSKPPQNSSWGFEMRHSLP